ncbi:MAG: hypothetical protein MZU97_11810 [Bacillus subtilis]|nr:hypothetical protein [Bacillus subtilis]
MVLATSPEQGVVPGIIRDDRISGHISKNRGIEDLHAVLSDGQEVPARSDELLSGHPKAKSSGSARAIANKETDPRSTATTTATASPRSAVLMPRSAEGRRERRVRVFPTAFCDGYGLNLRAVAQIIEDRRRSRHHRRQRHHLRRRRSKPLSEAGIDTIVTDHHEPKETASRRLRDRPSRSCRQTYPCKELAGVAVAYKLASAVTGRRPSPTSLDLVMIGTIADMMPLDDENQALVNLGLQQIQKNHQPRTAEDSIAEPRIIDQSERNRRRLQDRPQDQQLRTARAKPATRSTACSPPTTRRRSVPR